MAVTTRAISPMRIAHHQRITEAAFCHPNTAPMTTNASRERVASVTDAFVITFPEAGTGGAGSSVFDPPNSRVKIGFAIPAP